MNDSLSAQYMAKLAAQLKEGTCSPEEALARAYALGAETERMEAMHHACSEYSRAKAAREAAFGTKLSR